MKSLQLIRYRLPLSYVALTVITIAILTGLTVFLINVYLVRQDDRRLAHEQPTTLPLFMNAEVNQSTVSCYQSEAGNLILHFEGTTLITPLQAEDILILQQPNANISEILDVIDTSSAQTLIDDPRNESSAQRVTCSATMPTLTDDDTQAVIGIVQPASPQVHSLFILRRAPWGWLAASLLTLLFATLIGWRTSTQLTLPLKSLVEATQQMAAGQLKVRAKVLQPDEIGILGQNFNHMAEEIERKINTLSIFLSDAAHELYTPITALRGSVELVRETGSEKALIRATEQVTRLETIVRDLLNLSRVEATRHDVPKSFDLQALIDEVIPAYASHAESAHIDLHFLLPGASLPFVGHRTQIRCVIENLLDNALKYTPAGGDVTLHCTQTHDDIGINVSDTGIGIPADDQPHIFERFRRGHNVGSTPGTGLGLAIVRAVVDAHQGMVTVTSSSSGTIVQLKFPHVRV